MHKPSHTTGSTARSPSHQLVLRPTPQGWVLAILGGLALSSVMWPGQPLVFSLGVALVLAIVVAMVVVPHRLRRVRATWLDPGPLHAGDDIVLGATVRAASGTGPVTVGAWDPLLERLSFITDLPGVAPAATRVAWPTRFPRRGVFELAPVVVRNEQPFGVLFAQQACGEQLRVTVRPALGTMVAPLAERLRRWFEEGGLTPDPGDDDVSHLRGYRPGDPMRRINWRASARARRLLVTQRQAPASRHLALVLDTRCRHHRSRRFERLLSATATVIDHLAADGWQLSLHGLFAPAGVRGERERLLDVLAEIETCRDGELASALPRGEPCLVLSLDDPGPLPADTRALVLTLNDLAEAIRLPRVEA